MWRARILFDGDNLKGYYTLPQRFDSEDAAREDAEWRVRKIHETLFGVGYTITTWEE
jgi:hypothetical protein